MEETDKNTAQSCPDCHALVADLDAHKRWHQRVITDIAKAVERDIERVLGSASSPR
jgi:hypothetical protein